MLLLAGLLGVFGDCCLFLVASGWLLPIPVTSGWFLSIPGGFWVVAVNSCCLLDGLRAVGAEPNTMAGTRSSILMRCTHVKPTSHRDFARCEHGACNTLSVALTRCKGEGVPSNSTEQESASKYPPTVCTGSTITAAVQQFFFGGGSRPWQAGEACSP